MANEKNNIAYGNPKFMYSLGWKDESKRDELVILDVKDANEVMNQRAKGTTVYDLIKLYGGIDEVTEAFSDKEKTALYDDVSDMPQFANDEEYYAMLNRLQKQLDELKAREEKPADEPASTPADENTEGDK